MSARTFFMLVVTLCTFGVVPSCVAEGVSHMTTIRHLAAIQAAFTLNAFGESTIFDCPYIDITPIRTYAVRCIHKLFQQGPSRRRRNSRGLGGRRNSVLDRAPKHTVWHSLGICDLSRYRSMQSDGACLFV
jgi:hypothetical protein